MHSREQIQTYLDEAIESWREHEEGAQPPMNHEQVTRLWTEKQRLAFLAPIYVDAFQAVRDSILGSVLPPKIPQDEISPCVECGESHSAPTRICIKDRSPK
jgi:hypothetical protein